MFGDVDTFQTLGTFDTNYSSGNLDITFFRDDFGREDNVITIIYEPLDYLDRALFKELENISKNKKIESETKTSIGDLIQEELDDSSKE